MAERSGFFNALKTGTGYDIKYNANDYSQNLAAIISNGVRRSGDNELRVTAAGGLRLSVSVGRAWIEGHWYINDAVYTALSVPTPPVGDQTRIDRVVLRLDENVSGRKISLAYLQGTPAVSPTAPALTREGGIYEICLAEVKVGVAVAEITQRDIADTRPDRELCGWITSPVGYDEWFANHDAEFAEWFGEKKDTLASVTLFKQYHQRIELESQTDTVTFSIPQYDPTGVDIVEVYANGLRLAKGTEFTISGAVVTFAAPKIAGTDIDIIVYKSIDGTGLGSVSDEVADLQSQMSTIKNIGEYLYICNGYDDNVRISEIAQAFFEDASLPDDAQLTLNVYGTLGINAPFNGSGTSVSRFRWFSVGASSSSVKRRIAIDFLNASPINMVGTGENHYICFYGSNVTIKNAVIVARQRGSTTAGSVEVFVAPYGRLSVERCKIDLSAYLGSSISGRGTFVDCIGNVTNSRDDSYCFKVGGILRVIGGTYAAYTGLSTSKSAVFGDSGSAGGVAAYGVNCPTVAKASHYQTHAVYSTNALTRGTISDPITLLQVVASGGNLNVRDQIKVGDTLELF